MPGNLSYSGFSQCCGLVIIHGFGGQSNGHGSHTFSKDELHKSLYRQWRNLKGSYAAMVAVLNGHQNRRMGEWLVEFGFERTNPIGWIHPSHTDHNGEYMFTYRFRDEERKIINPTIELPKPPQHPEGPSGKWIVKRSYGGDHRYYSRYDSWTTELTFNQARPETATHSYYLQSAEQAEELLDNISSPYVGTMVPYIKPEIKPVESAPIAVGAFSRAGAAVAPTTAEQLYTVGLDRAFERGGRVYATAESRPGSIQYVFDVGQHAGTSDRSRAMRMTEAQIQAWREQERSGLRYIIEPVTAATPAAVVYDTWATGTQFRTRSGTVARVARDYRDGRIGYYGPRNGQFYVLRKESVTRI